MWIRRKKMIKRVWKKPHVSRYSLKQGRYKDLRTQLAIIRIEVLRNEKTRRETQ